MMRPNLTHRAGSRRAVTLPELMIAMSICSVIAIATIGTYVIAVRGTAKSFRFNKSIQEARMISDTLSKDLRSTTAFDATAVYFDGTTTHTAGPKTMILDLPRIDEKGQIIDIDSPTDKIVYETDPENSKILYRRVYAAAGSSRQSGSRCYGDSYGTTAYSWAWEGAVDNALGRTVVYYELMIERTLKGKTYRTPISGLVNLRNKTPEIPGTP